MRVDIIVLNYNGKELLGKYLPSINNAAGESSNDCKVYVLDNLSQDGSVVFLRKNFPEVIIESSGANRVLCSYNEFIEKLNSDVVVLLNNDIKVASDFVDYLIGHFGDKKIMFVAPRLMNFDGTFNGGKSYLKFKNGAVKVIVDYGNFDEAGTTCAIATGAFRRKAFLDMGGFDDLYFPGIWEEVDLCYRAMTRGWKGVYEPKSVIWHDEATTFHREYGRRGKLRIAHRNMFLFFWKNITDMRMFITHIILTPPRLILQYLLGRREPLEGFFMALSRIRLVLKRRKDLRAHKGEKILKDRDIIR